MIHAKVLKDTQGPHSRVTTMVVTIPRSILPQMNTHRVFSRISQSNRYMALPETVKTIKEGIPESIYIPSNVDSGRWIDACLQSCDTAIELMCPRLIEPFMWHKMVITATDWGNFFSLRTHPAAATEMRHVANEMLREYKTSDPQDRRGHDVVWHIPLDHDPRLAVAKISRISRLPYMADFESHVSSFSTDANFHVYDKLKKLGHMSPFEHVAWQTKDWVKTLGNLSGWVQKRKDFYHEANPIRTYKDTKGGCIR